MLTFTPDERRLIVAGLTRDHRLLDAAGPAECDRVAAKVRRHAELTRLERDATLGYQCVQAGRRLAAPCWAMCDGRPCRVTAPEPGMPLTPDTGGHDAPPAPAPAPHDAIVAPPVT